MDDLLAGWSKDGEINAACILGRTVITGCTEGGRGVGDMLPRRLWVMLSWSCQLSGVNAESMGLKISVGGRTFSYLDIYIHG